MPWRKAEAERMVCVWQPKHRRDLVSKYLALATQAVDRLFALIRKRALIQSALSLFMLSVHGAMQTPDQRSIQ